MPVLVGGKSQPKKPDPNQTVPQWIVAAVAGGFAGFMWLVLYLTGNASLPFVGPPPVITLGEYNQIQQGMSVGQVQSIVGDPGTETVNQPSLGPGIPSGQIYQWVNQDGSNAIVQFQDGKMIIKAQTQLD